MLRKVVLAAILITGKQAAAAESPSFPLVTPPAWHTTLIDFAANTSRILHGDTHIPSGIFVGLRTGICRSRSPRPGCVVRPAYLHDIAAFPAWANDKLDHADVAADIVEKILKATGFPMSKIHAVRGAVRTQMFDRDPSSPEAKYLHDSDALDSLGAI